MPERTPGQEADDFYCTGMERGLETRGCCQGPVQLTPEQLEEIEAALAAEERGEGTRYNVWDLLRMVAESRKDAGDGGR